jgi:two-component system, NtrC family, sensor kinase
MLENAVRICDAKFGGVYRCDGDTFSLVATHNLPPAYAEVSKHALIVAHASSSTYCQMA